MVKALVVVGVVFLVVMVVCALLCLVATLCAPNELERMDTDRL